jgi:hypothetical protein
MPKLVCTDCQFSIVATWTSEFNVASARMMTHVSQVHGHVFVDIVGGTKSHGLTSKLQPVGCFDIRQNKWQPNCTKLETAHHPDGQQHEQDCEQPH